MGRRSFPVASGGAQALRFLFLRVVLALIAVAPSSAFAQSILTVAGGGPIGDGLQAARAVLVAPKGVGVDASGNVYIADEAQHRIRKVDASSGVVTTFAGGGTSGIGDGGPATLASVEPASIVFDKRGDMIIADGGRIRRIDMRTGIISTSAGGGSRPWEEGIPALEVDNAGAFGIAIDSSDSVYLADPWRLRVLKLDSTDGRLHTVAGSGESGFSGDGGPATLARLGGPRFVTVDRNGNVYFADWNNQRVRRVDAKSGIITTYAGSGSDVDGGDGAPATEAYLQTLGGLTFDTEGNLIFAALTPPSWHIRRVAATTGIITTVPGTETGWPNTAQIELDSAGNLLAGSPERHVVVKLDPRGLVSTVAGSGSIGDGGPAIAANLFGPQHIVFDSAGDVLIPDTSANRLRKLIRSTGEIVTIAGNGMDDGAGDGGPATAASIPGPRAVTTDAAGNIYLTDGWSSVRRIDGSTGVISTILSEQCSVGIALDGSGRLLLALPSANQVVRFDPSTGVVTRIAGIAGTSVGCARLEGGFSGDGGPATAAQLNAPEDVALDDAGNVFIADRHNSRVRRVDAATSIITTVAGGGEGCADGCPATQQSMGGPRAVTVDRTGTIYIATHATIYRIQDGLAWFVAGQENRGIFTGDEGPASTAGLMFPAGIAVDSANNVFIADTGNQRIRAVFKCGAIGKPQLTSPINAAPGVPTAASLSWTLVDRAFRYDVLLDTANPPKRFAAKDLTSNVFTVSNLKAGATYYWKVIAKGDPLCFTQSVTGSEVRSFTTATACQAPVSFDLTGPMDGATGVSATPALTWNAAPGAGAYDLYIGSSNPPPLAATVTATTFTPSALVAGTSYSWFVVAHASCDTTLTTRTTTRSFTVAGGCSAAGSFALTAPTPGATNVPATTSLEWSASANASSYDLYLGTTNPPAIYLPDLTKTRIDIAAMLAGRTYYWRVVAKVSCDPAKAFTTAVGRFTTRNDCTTPGSTSIVFSPPGRVGTGQSYVIAWSAAPGLDSEGSYLVERSLDASFSNVADSQQVISTSASFVARVATTYYHRVRAVAGCDTTKRGPVSTVESVTAIDAVPNVVFTVQPQALVSPIGRNLEDNRGSFALENISNSTVQVILGKAEIESAPFFRIVDLEGGDGVFVTLLPHQPKVFELRFSGPPNDRDGSFQGLVIVSVPSSPIVPYAFVSLKVGSGAGTAPRLRFGGVRSEYAYFPGLDGDDDARAPITVQIENPGSSAMDVAAEIGPEVWLVPEKDWNTASIPAGGSRSVRLYTRRNRAPNGSALPRYTYLTVRTRDGATARMLVQDNAASSVTQGRTELLGAAVRSLVVPDVVSTASRISRIRLSNAASDPVQATLVFTPTGSDGFDRSAVRSAIVVVPPNDVATLTDPIVQIFNLTRPSSGQIEVVTALEKTGFLTVSATLAAPSDASARAVEIPTLWRGEGARAGAPHVVPGVTLSPAETTAMTLVETTGVDGASVKLTLVGKDGVARGNKTKTILRYGRIEIASIVGDLSGLTSMTAGRVEIEIVSGGGSVVGIATISDPAGTSGAAIASRPLGGPTVGKQRWVDELAKMPWAASTGSVTMAMPFAANGATATGLQTLLGLLGAKDSAITFTITFTDLTGNSATKTVTVPAGAVIEYPNVLAELFGIVAAAQGTLLIEMTPAGGDAYTRLLAAPSGGSPSAAGTLPIVPTSWPGLTSGAAGQQRPLYLDGLEQSTDSTRGFRWNLYLTELRGSVGFVRVSLYEAGNRAVPLAEKTMTIGALQQLRLETVFSALGLDSDERRKDRTNVMVSVTPVSGTGLISACATSVDNRTGDTKAHLLVPAGGVPTTTPSLAAPVEGGRKRPVRR